MEIKEQVPLRLTCGILKTIHDIRYASKVRLLRQIANTHNITWVFEGYHVVRVPGNGPCVFLRRKQILREVDARDVFVMRSSGEQIQDDLPRNHTSNRPTRECLVSGVWGTGFECFLEYPCGNGSLRFACL